MESLTRFRINEPQVIQETIEGESVIVNLESGSYFSVEKVGAEIWQNIEQGKSIGEILNAIFSAYDGDREDIKVNVEKFVNELMKEDLVVQQNSEIESENINKVDESKVQSGQKKLFEAPDLKKFTDVQDLLLLDPIHEADETGWPNIKADINK